MQQAQEAAAETEAQRLRHFRFVVQGGVVESQLFQRLAQGIVLIGLDRIQAGKDLRLDFLEARQRFRRAGTNSESFVRLFLTLGENTLDYLSRINK